MALTVPPGIPWNDPRYTTIAYPSTVGSPVPTPTPTPRLDPIPDPGFPEPEIPTDWTGGYGTNTPAPTDWYNPLPTVPGGSDFTTGLPSSGGNWWDSIGNTLSGVASGFMEGMGKLWDPKLLMFPAAFASAYKQWQDAEKYRDTAQGVADSSREAAQGVADSSRNTAAGIAGSSRDTAGGIAGSSRDAAQEALQYGDPFGAGNRSHYQSLLQASYDNPEAVLNDPGHLATLKSGLDTVARQNASKGYLGSGNMEADLAAFTANENAKFLDSYRAGLVPLTGSQFNPASAGNFLMQGEDLAGRSLMQGEDLAGRSLMNGENTAANAIMTGEGRAGDYIMRGNEQSITSQNAALQALMYPFMNAAGGTSINNTSQGGTGGGGQGGTGQGGGGNSPGIGPGRPINWSNYTTSPQQMAAEILRVTGGLGGTAASIMRGILSGDYQGISPSTQALIEDMAKDPTYVNVPFSQIFPSSQPGGGDIPFPYGISDPNSFGGIIRGDGGGQVTVGPITEVDDMGGGTFDDIPPLDIPPGAEPDIPIPEDIITDDWEWTWDDIFGGNP